MTNKRHGNRYYWGEVTFATMSRQPPQPDKTSGSQPTGKQIHSGNTHAFDRLYADLGPRVFGYLLRLTGSRAEAEDLMQETFLAAYTGRASFAGKSQPLAWLLGIARRRWRDTERRCKPESAALSGEIAEQTASRQEAVAETVSRSATLEAALARLSPAQRDIILLVFVQGLTYREAAEVTGEPIGTVGWRVSEATRALRRLLSEDPDETKDGTIRENDIPKATARASARADRTSCRR